MADFIDPEFPASPSSVYMDPSKPASEQVVGGGKEIQWKRHGDLCPQGLTSELFVNGITPSDCVMGSLADCYLIGALAVIAKEPERIRNIVKKPGPGKFEVRIFGRGEWHTIVVDDSLPCVSAGGVGDEERFRLVFSHSTDANELWVAIVEKAFAKYAGCYEGLRGGNVSEALHDLTGCPVLDMNLSNADHKAAVKDGSLFVSMMKHHEQKNLMSCNSISPDCEDEVVDNGSVIQNHAYSILECRVHDSHKLIRLRNPQGNGSHWTGAWGLTSKKWTADLRQALDCPDPESTTETSAEFWMTFTDFAKQFNRLYVCMTACDSWTTSCVASAWTDGTAGGCSDNVTWSTNPMFKVSVSVATPVQLLVAQPDARCTPRAGGGVRKMSYNQVGVTVVKMIGDVALYPAQEVKQPSPAAAAASTASKKTAAKQGKGSTKAIESPPAGNFSVVATSSFWNKREVSFEVSLEPNQDYLVVPSTYYAEQNGPFWLSCICIAPLNVTAYSLEAVTDSSTVKGEWDKKTAGGRPKFDTFRTNPQFLFTPSAPMKVAVILSQKVSEKSGAVGAGIYALAGMDGRFEEQTLAPSACIGSFQFTNTVEVVREFNLDPSAGPVLFIPCTYEQAKMGPFTLTVYWSKHQGESQGQAAASDANRLVVAPPSTKKEQQTTAGQATGSRPGSARKKTIPSGPGSASGTSKVKPATQKKGAPKPFAPTFGEQAMKKAHTKVSGLGGMYGDL